MKNSFFKNSWEGLKVRNLLWLLSPLSFIFLIASVARAKLYKIGLLKTVKPTIPTICIGNITVGGNGKTPLTLYLAEEFSKRKLKTSILTRGYSGSNFSKPHLVSSGDTVSSIGDEAMIYRSKLPNSPIVISPKRSAGARLLAKLKSEIILMDDGFQHFAIEPNVKLCLVDLGDIQHYKNGSPTAILPAGIFRELPSTGIARSDRVVFIKRSAITDDDRIEIKDFTSRFKLDDFSIIEIQAKQFRDGFTNQIKVPFKKGIVTFSSIAKPESFLANLKTMGYEVIKNYTFKDHHKFTRKEFSRIYQENEHPIICTFKDFVKVQPWITKESRVYFLEQEIVDRSSDGNELFAYLVRELGVDL